MQYVKTHPCNSLGIYFCVANTNLKCFINIAPKGRNIIVGHDSNVRSELQEKEFFENIYNRYKFLMYQTARHYTSNQADFESCNINLSLLKSLKPFCYNAFTVSLV